MTRTWEYEETSMIAYQWTVTGDAATPIPPGKYEVRLAEGGRYRNAASGRVYSVREITSDTPPRIRYEYTRGENAEVVSREGMAEELAVVQAVGETPDAIVDFKRQGEPSP